MRRLILSLVAVGGIVLGSVLAHSEARADINNPDSNIATCIAGFGFYSLSGLGLGCAYVNDATDTFPGTPITTGGFGYTQFGFHQNWLNILHNMGLQGW